MKPSSAGANRLFPLKARQRWLAPGTGGWLNGWLEIITHSQAASGLLHGTTVMLLRFDSSTPKSS